MCTDKNHGGRRCANDTSAMRRMRRKASAETSKASKQKEISSILANVTTGNFTTGNFKQEAKILKELLAADTGNVTQSEHDMIMEQKITQLGSAIAEEAEKMVGYDPVKFAAEINALEDTVYAESDEALNALKTEYRELYEHWTDMCESRGWGRNVSPNQDSLPESMDSRLSPADRTLLERIKTNRDANRALSAESLTLNQTYKKRKAAVYDDMNKKLAAAYQGLIANIRPVGGTVAVSDSSDASAVTIMDETVAKHYPTEWLQHHNDAHEVVFKQSARRASYNKSAWSETETDEVDKTKRVFNPIKFTVDDNSEERVTEIVAMLKEELAGYEALDVTSSSGTGTKIREVVFIYEEETLYDPEKHGVLNEHELEGEGWVKKPTVISLDEVESTPEATVEELRVIVSKPRWVKTVTTTAKKENTLTIGTEEYLKANTLSSDTHDAVKAIAYHEFGHRIEDVMPGKTLTRLEKAFLKRRSGKTDDTYYDNMTHTEGSSERYHGNTNFVASYVGRVYYMDDSTEVFTTGIEALYGGSYGGLVGNSFNYKTTDKDHRGFVLGALAVL